MMGRIWTLTLALCVAIAGTASAQDPRGTITGRVVDSSGAQVPGVTVTVRNVATNVASTTTTNSDGLYNVPYLTPGEYSVTVELSGFKKIVRDGIEVRVADRLALDFKLELGRMEETVSVTAQSPLLETASASAGQVIDEKRIALLPLSDGNPFVLSRLVPGIAYTGDLKFSRPFDNAGTSSITADGATGGNEFTLDGSPNMASGRRVAFVPPAGAVQEFKVSTASFDAGEGHSAGALVNVTLKSGTNRVKGEGYYFKRSDALAEIDFFQAKSKLPKTKMKYDRPGGFTGGPLRLPGIYDGHNRTFFFGAVEWLYDEFPEPGPQTVPSVAMRGGDFSELLAQGIQIFDPLTAVRSGARIVRTPFENNIIPSQRISPIAREILKYYPLPNQAGNLGRDNFFSSNPRSDDFYSISTRFDHRLNSKQQTFVRYTRNNRRESRGAYFGSVNGVTPTGNFLFRVNDGVTFDDVYAMSPSTVLDLRAGWQRFQEPNVRQHEGVFDPAQLGFAPSVTALFLGVRYFPQISVDNVARIGENLAATTIHSIYSFQPTLTRIAGRHSLRAGYDMRLYKESSSNLGGVGGEYTFANTYTRALDNSSGSTFGQSIAALLLGQPTGGSIARNGARLNYTLFNGLFVQDDWKIGDRLTINLGLRYELENATIEAQNRNVRGFDPNATISIAAASKAAYALSPIPELPVSSFNPRGGLMFASASNRGFWETDRNNWQPRVGFAYQLNRKTVLRAGAGIYTVPAIISGNLQHGYSQSTSLIVTDDVGLTFKANLATPFPGGVLEPIGNSKGADTFLGQAIGRFAPLDLRNPQNARYTISLQRELPGQWLVDAAYTGSHGWDQTVDVDLNAIPAQYLSRSLVRDQATIDFLGGASATFPSPFAGLVPGTGLNSNITRGQLLRPFPQFTGVTTSASNGSTSYNSFQLKVEHRFVQGYTLLLGYTRSKFLERTTRLNATDTGFEERLSGNDVPYRLSLSGIWEVPFGKGRRWATDTNRLIDSLVGGWSLQLIGQIQSGTPLDFGNLYYNGDPTQLKIHYSKDTDVPVFDTSGFYFHDAAVQTNGVDDPVRQRSDTRIQLASNIRTFRSRYNNLRNLTLNTWDVSMVKQVPVTGRVRAQLNIEVLNATNQVYFNSPSTNPVNNVNFAKVTTQNNLPREVQLAFKLNF